MATRPPPLERPSLLEYWDFDGTPVSVDRARGVVTAWDTPSGRRISRWPNPASDTPIDKPTFDRLVAQRLR